MVYKFVNSLSCPDFYKKLGPFFASKKIRKELGGYPLNNEDNWVWMIAQDKDNVIGFICFDPCNTKLLIHDCYVSPGYRGKGVFSNMINHVINYSINAQKDLYISVLKINKPILEKFSFLAIKQRGQWFTMRRIINEKLHK